MKPNLRNVTLIVFDHRQPKAAINLIAAMMDAVDFGDVKYLNHFDGWEAFNYWENYEAWKYVKTDFAMYMHLDGYIVNPQCWRPEFQQYDYIGAPWPVDLNKDRVGNGGFSMRSRRFMQRVAQLPWQKLPGDVLTCSHYRQQLIDEGFTFAPVDVAAQFSVENPVAEHARYPRTFGFHGVMPRPERPDYTVWTETRRTL